mgnify:CR=1 FL=1
MTSRRQSADRLKGRLVWRQMSPRKVERNMKTMTRIVMAALLLGAGVGSITPSLANEIERQRAAAERAQQERAANQRLQQQQAEAARRNAEAARQRLSQEAWSRPQNSKK